jgi:glycerophosphoryl diester phosphodiesterase
VDAVIPPLHHPPIAFAHRGARAHAPENTLDAFRLAVRLGATGIESDVWLTADGHPVLAHSGAVGRRWRRRPISEMNRADLPDHLPTLRQLYAELDGPMHLSLDVKDPQAVPAVLAVAGEVDGAALRRLWLCHSDWPVLAEWRSLSNEVRLVASTRIHLISEGPERLAAALADAGIDALSLYWSDWTGGLTTLLHRFGRYAFGWDAQHERAIAALLRMGADGIYSDHVDRLVEQIQAPGVRET